MLDKGVESAGVAVWESVARHDGPTTMATSETAWWERERATFIRSRIVALSSCGDYVVDVGCGRGTLLDAEVLGTRRRINVDSHLWTDWNGRDGLFVVASADALPFRDESFAVSGSFDVLEHLESDRCALAELNRVTTGGGAVLAAVPGDSRLWSAHDEAVGHYRRYSRDSLSAAARAQSLESNRETYFFSYLWLPAWLVRGRASRPEPSADKASVVGWVVDSFIRVLALFERAVLRRVDLPFGTSLWMEFEASPKR